VNIGAPNTTIHVTSGADPQRPPSSAKWCTGRQLEEISGRNWIVNQFPLASAPTAPIGRRDGGRPLRASCRNCIRQAAGAHQKPDLLFAQLFHASGKAGLFL
jgi:hypothetical protein